MMKKTTSLVIRMSLVLALVVMATGCVVHARPLPPPRVAVQPAPRVVVRPAPRVVRVAPPRVVVTPPRANVRVRVR